jgi:hypothetical protein
MSLAAICITTFLAFKNISTNERLRAAERQRANLARFFSPQRVDQLMEIDTPLSVARRQPAAVLFVDMVGFTAYCCKLTPDEVIARLRDLQALLSASVLFQLALSCLLLERTPIEVAIDLPCGDQML